MGFINIIGEKCTYHLPTHTRNEKARCDVEQIGEPNFRITFYSLELFTIHICLRVN